MLTNALFGALFSVSLRGFCLLIAFPLVVSLLQAQDPIHAQDPFLLVLGTAQDGGYPQAGCQKECCKPVWADPSLRRFVSCVAVVDPKSGERWMFDCTPDFRDQLRLLDLAAPRENKAPLLHGVFPTHAHVGHYTGLMMLGREVLGAAKVPVYCMPRMKYFLETNGPWSQLVELKQIELNRIAAGQSLQLNERIAVTPFLVPHRDEFSETVGFRIQGPNHAAVYLPDIDKWERWSVKIEDIIDDCDLAFLDGTFFDGDELPGRNMSEIPHPFVSESIQRLGKLSAGQRGKVHFIHFNHSNPLNQATSKANATLKDAGCAAAQQWHLDSEVGRFSL